LKIADVASLKVKEQTKKEYYLGKLKVLMVELRRLKLHTRCLEDNFIP
jgi:hypothetical protein